MAKYKKRADGRYAANIVTGHDPETGKRIYAPTIYAHSTIELDNRKTEVKDYVNKGIYADDKKTTVKAWAKKWLLTDKATAGIRDREMYENMVNYYIIPEIGSFRLRDLKRSDVQIMINNHMEKPRTCQQLRMATRQMLKSAIGDKLIYQNVATDIKVPKNPRPEKRALNQMEKNAIKNSDFTEKEKSYIYTLLYCGFRRGEALALSRSSVNLNKNEIYIQHVVTFDHGHPVLKSTPKSDADIRTIPIPEALKEVLEPYIKSLKGLYLFESDRMGGLMSKSSYDKFWGKIFKKMNTVSGGTDDINILPWFSGHIFKHNYITELYYAGVPAKESQMLAGHADVKLTLEIYTHLDRLRDVAPDKLRHISML